MNRKVELSCIAALFVLGIFAVGHGLSLPLMGPVATSPGLFPTFVGGLMTILCGGFLARRIMKDGGMASARSREKEEPGGEGGPEGETPYKTANNLAIIIGILLAYAVLLPVIHFIPASLAFGFALMGYALRKITIRASIIIVASVLIINYTFSLLFRVILP